MTVHDYKCERKSKIIIIIIIINGLLQILTIKRLFFCKNTKLRNL